MRHGPAVGIDRLPESTLKSCEGRSCHLRNDGPGFGRRPPTTHAGNASCARTLFDDAVTKGWSGRHPPGALMRHGLSDAADHTVGSRREESLRARSGFAARRRAPTAVGGRSQARRCVCGTVLRPTEISTLIQSMVSAQGCRSRGDGMDGRGPWSEARAAPQSRPRSLLRLHEEIQGGVPGDLDTERLSLQSLGGGTDLYHARRQAAETGTRRRTRQ